jgi:hypothetical protein
VNDLNSQRAKLSLGSFVIDNTIGQIVSQWKKSFMNSFTLGQYLQIYGIVASDIYDFKAISSQDLKTVFLS